VTTKGHDYDTRRWQVTVENEHTHFSVERIDQTIIIRGIFKGEPVDKQLVIDERPWYQATSLPFANLLFAARESTRTGIGRLIHKQIFGGSVQQPSSVLCFPME
jgi:hypothetical protein